MADFFYPFKTLLLTFRDYRLKIVLLACLGFFSSMLAAVGIGAVVPLLSFFVEGDGGGEMRSATGAIMRYFEYLPFPLTPVSVITTIVAVFFLRAVLMIFLSVVSVRIRSGYRRSTKTIFLDKLLSASWPFFTKQKIGHVTDTLMRDVDVTSKLIEDAVNIILSVSNIVVFTAMSFWISPNITIFAIVLGISAAAFFQKIWRRGKEIGAALLLLSKETSQLVTEHMIGAKTVKSLGVEEAVHRRGVEYFRRGEDLTFKSGILSALYSVAIEPLTILFISGVFLFSYFSSEFDLGVFAATLIFVQRIFVYFGSAQLSFHVINEKISSAIHLIEFEKSISANPEKVYGKRQFSFRDSLSFENVGFGYVSGINIFSGINFSVKRGEMVGIVGPSGSGKTTVADLSMRLVEPSKGRVFLDGILASEYDLHSWRVNMGYVSQEPFLLNDTIEANIRFYSGDVDNAALAGAAKKAQIYAFVQTLPEKFNTMVGDRGVMLSGGQRQRIALARVLVRNPQVLILDEATSALDNESEALIQKAVRELKGKVTIIVIAHRFSTVVDLDRILVLDKGKIAEEGRPHELLDNKDSYFYRMYHLKGST